MWLVNWFILIRLSRMKSGRLVCFVSLLLNLKSSTFDVFLRWKETTLNLKETARKASATVFPRGVHVLTRSPFLQLLLGEANAKIEAKPEIKGKSNSSPANSFGSSVRSYYHSTVPLPHSCIAIAVGHWEEAGVVDITLDVQLDKFEPKQLYLPTDGCGHEPYPCRLGTDWGWSCL